MSKDDVDVVISSVVGTDAGGKTSTTIIRRAVEWKSESEIRTLIVGLLVILYSCGIIDPPQP